MFLFEVGGALARFELVNGNLNAQHARFVILFNYAVCAVRLQLNPPPLSISLFEFVNSSVPKANRLIILVKQVDVDSVFILNICFVFFFCR